MNKQNGPGSSSKLHKCRCCEKSKTPESALILLPKAVAGERSPRLIFNAKSPQRTPTAWRDFTLIVRGRVRGFSRHTGARTPWVFTSLKQDSPAVKPDAATRRPQRDQGWHKWVSFKVFSKLWVNWDRLLANLGEIHWGCEIKGTALAWRANYLQFCRWSPCTKCISSLRSCNSQRWLLLFIYFVSFKVAKGDFVFSWLNGAAEHSM